MVSTRWNKFDLSPKKKKQISFIYTFWSDFAPFVKILPMVSTRWNKFRPFTEKSKYPVNAFNPFWEKLYQNPVPFFSVIPRGVPLPHSSALQDYVKREKCKVNDVIFLSGCDARAINLGNKNMKIGIFTVGTSVRSKNISPIFLDFLPESMK